MVSSEPVDARARLVDVYRINGQNRIDVRSDAGGRGQRLEHAAGTVGQD